METTTETTPGAASGDAAGGLVCIVLAAGKGTRMKSARPKVLHDIAGRAMLNHVLDACAAMAPERVVTVVGAGGEAVAQAARSFSPPCAIAVQDPPLGTGHAVLAAREACPDAFAEALILYADTPLIRPETLAAMRAARAAGAGVVVLGFTPPEPGAYGRLVLNGDGGLEAIVEAKDASPEQLAIPLCNSGVMAVGGSLLFELLATVDNDNAKGEYYLTDIVARAREKGLPCAVVEADAAEVLGVNSRTELAVAEATYQRRRRTAAMEDGVTLADPDTVYFAWDTTLGRDVTIGQNVVFGPGVVVEDTVEIKPFCHIEGARVARGSVVGPFARLRPGADIGQGSRIGNFVEVKNAVLEPGVKVNHLSYIGDAQVGAHTNVGAGAITCNYDGYDKHRTVIGENVFVGTNASLVAPITVGDGAFIGAGSTVTKSVSADALAVTRADQREVAGWAARNRARRNRKADPDPSKSGEGGR